MNGARLKPTTCRHGSLTDARPSSWTQAQLGTCAEMRGPRVWRKLPTDTGTTRNTPSAAALFACKGSVMERKVATMIAPYPLPLSRKTGLIIPTVSGSDLPGLLGLSALRKNRGILDLNTMDLYFCGPGDYDLLKALPPGTDTLHHLDTLCCLAVSFPAPATRQARTTTP